MATAFSGCGPRGASKFSSAGDREREREKEREREEGAKERHRGCEVEVVCQESV